MCSDEFADVIKKTTLHQRVPFDMDGGFIKLYFGKDKKRVIDYTEFSQFLHVCVHLCLLRHLHTREPTVSQICAYFTHTHRLEPAWLTGYVALSVLYCSINSFFVPT